MNLNFLKYFHDTIKLNSVTAAAAANFVTQSAISQGITQLEISLGTKLLTHKRKEIKITSEGKVVFERSLSIFNAVDGLKHDLKGTKDSYHGTLSFACSHSFALSVLPELLAKLRKLAPQVTPKVVFGHTGLMKEWIKRGEIEFGLVMDNDDLSSLSLELIYEGAFRFFQSRRRQKKKPITSCIFPPARAEVHLVKQQFLKKYGHHLETEMEICSWEVISKIIGMTSSVGFLPDYVALSSDKRSSIEVSPLKLNIPFKLFAAYPLDEEISRSAQLFVQLAKEIINQMKERANGYNQSNDFL